MAPLLKGITLDPSGKNPPESDSLSVESEVDFLRNDGKQDLWVSGYACDYVRRVYALRGGSLTEIESPENQLRLVIGSLTDRLSPETLKKCLAILQLREVENLAGILEEITGDDVWGLAPSYAHAARLLTCDAPEELSDLVEKQFEVWMKSVDFHLAELYGRALKDRDAILREWFSDPQIRGAYGEFPIKLVGKYAALLLSELGQQLRLSEGAAIQSFPRSTVNKSIYGKAIVDYFSHHGDALSADVLSSVSSFLSFNERVALEKLLPTSAIQPLAIGASLDQALAWAIERYLPQRTSQINDGVSFDADVMAASFADWLLESYPALTHAERIDSPLNIRTFYRVQNLAETHWILWVMVDGLSYANHERLIRLLASKSMSLRASENAALISILPTITERAKYGVTTGKFPEENVNQNWDTKKYFLSVFPGGVYAGNSGMKTLEEGLKSETPTVCYWNYTKIDKWHHEHVDSDYLRDEIDASLESLANHINRMVSTARSPDRVAVVISTDHGQLTAPCKRIEVEPSEGQSRGRTVLHACTTSVDMTNSYVKDSIGETAMLNPKSFRLGEPTTVALGPASFVSISDDSEGEIGMHGGLYPEEVVVGMAILVCNPEYLPVSAQVSGEGETGHEASIRLVIDNPNNVLVNPLSLAISSLTILDQGELLKARVGAQSVLEIDLIVEAFPQPDVGENFTVEGHLSYEFGDGRQETISLTGQLRCNALYKPKNPSLLNRFKA